MNPEFRRNLWLEMTPKRMVMGVVLLALAFFAAALTEDAWTPASLAVWLYYGIVVLWGSRNAALSVVGEIRDHTWDAQRLSSLSARQMTWGKLFGSTIYNWYAGGICLAVILARSVVATGMAGAVTDLVYYLEVGIIAQAAALLASLIAVRRRQVHSRAEIFVYQLAGILAAIAVYCVWEAANASDWLSLTSAPVLSIAWWGHGFDSRPFLLVSLAAFTAWILVGCYREMRLELKMENGPLVWLGFLVFIGIYVAGFDAWLSNAPDTAGWDVVGLRLGLAGTTFATLTYLMVFLEPKDRVHFRWLGTQLASGRLAAFGRGLQAFMTSYAAMALVTGTTMWWRFSHGAPAGEIALIGAGWGFITRDVALVVLLHALTGSRRGDFAGLMALFALYLLIPAILNGLGLSAALIAFYPKAGATLWLAPAIAWAEAVAVVVLAAGRIALSERAEKGDGTLANGAGA
jgi:hypothetical protein